MQKAIYAAVFVCFTLIVVASGGFQRLVMDERGHARLSSTVESISDYEARDWSVAIQLNTPDAYKTFLQLYPAGSHATEARKRVEQFGRKAASPSADLSSRRDVHSGRSSNPERSTASASGIEEGDWMAALKTNSLPAFRSFLDRYPEGIHAAEAEKRMEALARIQREWDSTMRENTVEGYREFAAKYTGISTSRDVVGVLAGYEDYYWKTITRENAPDLYDTYVRLFPQGDHVEEAESRLITLEVNKIFQDRHENIPSLNKTESADMACPDRSKVVLRNNTQFTLTILYSGPESRKFTLYPDETTTFGIKNGKYRIAAEGRTGQVYQLAGEQMLDGGEYQSTYNPRR